MITAFKAASVVTILLLALLSSGVTKCSFEVGSRHAPGLSREGVLSLRPGMTTDEVTKRIGEPLQRRKSPSRDGQEIWVYGEPGLCLEGLEVYAIMEYGNLYSVSIEHFDLGAYRCNRQECPRILNAEDFEKTFRNRNVR